MPTVINQDGFQILIYTHDHLPRHVHVWKAGKQIVINLEDGTVAKSYMSIQDARKARGLVRANLEFLIAEWDRVSPIS
jgi:hypothetical protein